MLSFVKNILNKDNFTHRNSWFQAYKPHNYHSLHVHGLESFEYSFVFYVQTSDDSSEIKFYNPGYPYCYYKDYVLPYENDLLIFNSYVPHEVLPNNDNQRISLAGNIQSIMKYYIFGIQRTCTNYAKVLVQNNFYGECGNKNDYGHWSWKHNGDAEQATANLAQNTPVIFVIKEPKRWLGSIKIKALILLIDMVYLIILTTLIHS